MRIDDVFIDEIITNINNLSYLEPTIKKAKHKLYWHLILLVDCGIINYDRLTKHNYEYWWYETNGVIDRNIFTADIRNFSITMKGYIIFNLRKLRKISYHEYLSIIDELNCNLFINTIADMFEFDVYVEVCKLKQAYTSIYRSNQPKLF